MLKDDRGDSPGGKEVMETTQRCPVILTHWVQLPIVLQCARRNKENFSTDNKEKYLAHTKVCEKIWKICSNYNLNKKQVMVHLREFCFYWRQKSWQTLSPSIISLISYTSGQLITTYPVGNTDLLQRTKCSITPYYLKITKLNCLTYASHRNLFLGDNTKIYCQ